MVNAPAESALTTVDLPRFGKCSYKEEDVFAFPWGLPGFEDLRMFIVIQLETQDSILWLQSLDDVNVSLPLGDPWLFFPDYDPKMPSFARLSLDLREAEDYTILAVMVGTDGGPTFMNLLAPIVVNLKTRIGRQVPLETSRYTCAMQIPVPAAVAEAQAKARAAAQAEPVSE
ncbi:MAG: flagellar assembly protein FliW [Candidatus Lustribacter sp.]|jgi:flagellar assembly factor FliW